MITLNAISSKPAAVRCRIDFCRRFLSKPPSYLWLSHLRLNLRLQSSNAGAFNRPVTPVGEGSFPNNSFWTAVKAVVFGGITAAALIIFSRHYSSSRNFLALPVPVETGDAETVTEEEMKKLVDVIAQSNDLDGLKKLREIETERRKIPQAIEVLNKLIHLDPHEEASWLMLKAQLHDYNGEANIARSLFDEMIQKDPLRIEAYHGLISTIFYNKSVEDLKYVESKAEEAIELCRNQNSEKGVMDFKLLIADIRTLEKEFDSALRIYEELEVLNSNDFRVYLGKGIVYSLMKRMNEAEENFEKYWDLVPEDYAHAKYFERDVVSGRYLGRGVENEEAISN